MPGIAPKVKRGNKRIKRETDQNIINPVGNQNFNEMTTENLDGYLENAYLILIEDLKVPNLEKT